MKRDLFMELLESVREGGAILCGEKEPSRTFLIEPAPKQLAPTPQQKDDERK